MRREKARINAKLGQVMWSGLAFLMRCGVLMCSAQKGLAIVEYGRLI